MNRVLAILFFIAFTLTGCSESSQIDTEYLGSWRLQSRKKLHTILLLKNNGTFEVDLRVEGQMTKIVEKKGSAAGAWSSDKDEGRFTLDITQGNPEIGWQTGIRNFEIVEMDGHVLVLASPDGKTYRWEKLRFQKSGDPSDTGTTSITLAPVVVNLSPTKIRANQRYKWLCVALVINLKSEDEAPIISPQLKDKIIIFLSSKRYEELNTQDKLKVVTGELRDMINPYMAGRVEKVIFEKTIVTGSNEAVDNFYTEYEK